MTREELEYAQMVDRISENLNDFLDVVIEEEKLEGQREDMVMLETFKILVSRMTATGAPLDLMLECLRNAHSFQMSYEVRNAEGRVRQ